MENFGCGRTPCGHRPAPIVRGMRIGGRAVIGLVTGCIALAACSGDPDDEAVTLPPTTETASTSSPPPSSTAAPTETETAEPTPTTILVLPDEHVASVDDFVADFFAALNAAKDSGDFAAYDAMYLPQCSGCIELREELQGWLADGQTVEGGDWIVMDVTSDALADGTSGGFSALAYHTLVSLTSSDASTENIPATEVYLFNGVLVGDGSWALDNIAWRTA